MAKAATALRLAGLIALGFFYAAWLLAPLGFPFELARHFPLHGAALAAGLAAAMLAVRRGRLAMVCAGASAALAGVWWTTPFAPVAPDYDRSTLTVAVFNAKGARGPLEQAARWAEAEGVDVLVLAEAHGVGAETLETIFSAWPHVSIAGARVALPDRAYSTPLAVFSKSALTLEHDHEHRKGDPFDRPRLHVFIDAGGRQVHLSALHPFPPILPGARRQRDALFAQIAERVPDNGRYIVAGDLNATPWSPGFQRLPGRRAGDPRMLSTFPAFAPAGGIAIDHIMIGEAFAVTRYAVGPDLGSDHRPVLAELRFVEDGP